MNAPQHIVLEDRQYGKINLLVTRPTDDLPWGFFTPIKNTSWSFLVREVSGEAYSHALHGMRLPLMKQLGPEPHRIASQVPQVDGECKNRCPNWNPSYCRVGGKPPRKKDLPGPPGCFSSDIEGAEVIALSIRSNCHPIVVIGPEFNVL